MILTVKRGSPSTHEYFYGLGPSMTDEQKTFLSSIYECQMTIVNARSGTGKTTLAVAAAKTLGKPLSYIFAPVEEGGMGFRPGTQVEKENDYLRPLRDALMRLGDDPDQAIRTPANEKSGKAWVEASSYLFWRGGNLDGHTLIIDEAQNWTLARLKMMLTRVHDSTKVIVIGHDGQIDLADSTTSGFTRLIEHFRDKPYARVCELTRNFRGQLANDADEM